MAFDLVLKQGLVLDPSQDLHDIRDIGIQNGEVFKAQSRFRNHVPGEPIPLIKGA
jgi:predicted amidohydrolase